MSSSGGSTGKGASGGGDSVTLRLKPKQGAIYVLESTSEAAGQSQVMTMNTKIVQSGDSAVVMETTFDAAAGQPDAMKGAKVTVTTSPLYQVQSVKVDSTDPMMAQMGKSMEAGMKMMPVFPENAIKPGDSWKGSFDLGKMMKDMGLPAEFEGDTVMDITYTFKGLEERDGRKVAIVTQSASDKLTMKISGQTQEMTMTVDGDNAFDIESGMVVGSTTNTKTSMMGQEQVQKQTVKLKEIK